MTGDVANIKLFYDGVLPKVYRDYLKDRGYTVDLQETIDAIERELRSGSWADVSTVIVHGGLDTRKSSHYRDLADVVRYVREEYPWVRIGVISGGYPDGKEEFREMGADFYGPLDIRTRWFKEQLDKGFVYPEREGVRGFVTPSLEEEEERWFENESGEGFERGI